MRDLRVVAVVEATRVAVGADVDDADVVCPLPARTATHAIAHFGYGAGARQLPRQLMQIELLHPLATNANGVEFEVRNEVCECLHTV